MTQKSPRAASTAEGVDNVWKDVDMDHPTCTVSDCTKPHKRLGYCYGHYMKHWRYGTPTPDLPARWIDVAGRRYGTLTVVERAGHRWRCTCDCGETRTLAAGDLNRTSDGITCGIPGRHLSETCGYQAAHDRVKRSRGPAKAHACVDCGTSAAHWSYRHDDPDELHEQIGATLVAYSPDAERYDPRCVPCHKRFDLHRLDAAVV